MRSMIPSPQAQKGVALALSLLLLLVLTIIGVAAMNSTIMQERMAGNIQTQTRSFETSAEGVGRALEFFHENAETVGGIAGHEFGLACGFIHSALADPPENPRMAWSFPNEGFIERDMTGATEGLRLGQRMYCCRSWAEAEVEGETDPVWIENPSKLFVLSRGSFVTGDGDAELATREIEVRLDEAEPGKPTCAFCIPGEVGDFGAPPANAFGMHGGCGPAITTEHPDGAAQIGAAIGDSNIDNYTGGITDGDMGEPWNDANKLAEFAWWIKLGLHEGDTDNPELGGYFAGDHSFDGGGREFGTEDAPAITYFDGDLQMQGNVSGHGIMVVAGTLRWGGTPAFQGLLVILGGSYSTGGGGKGGAQDPGGSIVTTNLVVNNTVLQDDPAIAGDTRAVLGGQGFPLPYQVAVDTSEDEVLMYDFNDIPDQSDNVRRARPGGDTHGSSVTNEHVPARPVLVDNAGRRLIYYFDPDDTLDIEDRHRFFLYDDFGSEIPQEQVVVDLANGIFIFLDSDDDPIARLEPQSDLPRDKFGRLIPNFIPMPSAGLNYSWPFDNTDGYDPPDNIQRYHIQYDPNRWGWGFCDDDDEDDEFGKHCNAGDEDTDTAPPFRFGASDFDWSGGGSQGFVYDCRRLQQMRHRLLCQEKDPAHDPDLDVDGDFYDEGDHSSVCDHWEAGYAYNENLDYPDSGIMNQHAWHLWSPRCECMGLTSDADMIIAGWRENLGWRDDDFAACEGLPAPPD